MDRPLILHIGYHRTGTTTLQMLVFPQLTRVAYFRKDKTLASALILSAFRDSPSIWRLLGNKILGQLLADMGGEKAERPALVSAEGMSTHRIFAAPGTPHSHRRDPFILAAHLRECQAVAQRVGFDGVKVIMGIRRQDHYLASRYVKMASMIDNPGQEDFERQTREIIDHDKRYFIDGVWLDFNRTRELIAEVVGEQNVLLVPLEQLADAPSRYLAALSEFVGEPLDGLVLEQKNARSVAPDVWQVGKKVMNMAARRQRFGKFRALFAQPITIRLSLDLKEEILATYLDSNRSLTSSLKLNLERYGYCGTNYSRFSSDPQNQTGS